MKCISCLLGLKWECRDRGECDDGSRDNRASGDSFPGDAIGSILGGGPADSENPDQNSGEDDDPGGPESEDDVEFRTYKDDSALRDQQSTGRKRAAKLFPLTDNAPCEWKMRKNCGGGQYPIVGCLDGIQQARHHGPDKNTLNNEKGNVHRICHSCHNRWHTLNDPDYVWGSVYDLHNPVEADVNDIAMNEVFWDGRAIVKAKD